MADIVDGFGAWETIAQLSPNTTEWQKLPGDCSNSSVFRFLFSLNWAEWENERSLRFHSYGLIKESYEPSGAGQAIASTTKKTIKIVPQRNPLLIHHDPLPFDYDTGNFSRHFLIKRVFWSAQNWAITRPDLDLPWSVQVQKLEID